MKAPINRIVKALANYDTVSISEKNDVLTIIARNPRRR